MRPPASAEDPRHPATERVASLPGSALKSGTGRATCMTAALRLPTLVVATDVKPVAAGVFAGLGGPEL